MLLTNIPPVAAAQLPAMAGSAPFQAQALNIDPLVRNFCLYVKYVGKRYKMPSFWTETQEPAGRKWGYLFDTVPLI